MSCGSSSSSPGGDSENPRKWRYTWESQSHITILKLFLFLNNNNNLSNLKAQLILGQRSHLRVTWYQKSTEVVELVIPVPSKVLIDSEAPVQLRALEDHVEVKLGLLLTVDHPIVVDFDGHVADSGPLTMDTEVGSLGSENGGVVFYCRGCESRLTGPIKSFAEMPSTNWREIADNWFGTCCCSFGGISEKLVVKYANAYNSEVGTCLLSTMFIVLCKDDLIGCDFPLGDKSKIDDTRADLRDIEFTEELRCDDGVKNERVACCDDKKEDEIGNNDSREANVAAYSECQNPDNVTDTKKPSSMSAASEFFDEALSASGCCGSKRHILTPIIDNDSLETSSTFSEDQELGKKFELLNSQKTFLDGFLGDVFMARSSNLSNDVHWVEFLCPHCSSLLGAYPADNRRTILDGGVRLFKCYVSTNLPAGGSNDLFRKYTLEKMFTNQLVENAKTELSYRTVIRDLEDKSAMLQIILLNPNYFLQGGYCSSTENKVEAVENVDMFSAIKVLFGVFRSSGESQLRMVEDWVKKDQADEVFMFARQIEELIGTLTSRKDMFPLSCTTLQGLSLSSMRR